MGRVLGPMLPKPRRVDVVFKLSLKRLAYSSDFLEKVSPGVVYSTARKKLIVN
jgi:hypothetical protein